MEKEIILDNELHKLEKEISVMQKTAYYEGIESALKMFEQLLDKEKILPNELTKENLLYIIYEFRKNNNERRRETLEELNDLK
ncbi:MAG: hypothetical protein K6E14_11350 [Paludibacteraceae bacterium]|nr:hypothetical protein [Paludibacteraceae bacterium]